MNFDLVTNNETCQYLVSQAPLSLIYYSHIPTVLVGLFMGVFIFLKSGRTLASRLLLVLVTLFAVWSLFDLILWTNYDTRLTMFFWSPLGMISMVICAVALYFTYVFFDGKDISFVKKLAIFGPIIPMIVLSPTALNLNTFNDATCEAVENHWFVNYSNIFGFAVIFWILVIAFMRYRKANNHKLKNQIVLFAVGIELFLASFFVTGYIASVTENFNIVIYGLFGMPVFMALLAYLIVKFKAFDIKLLGTQSLVITLVFLIGAQFFYVKTQTNFILTTVTFLLVILTGVFLVRSFKKSEERKEELQIMADRLAISNDRLRELDNTKTEFISIASHQLRTPLTAIKGYCSLLIENSYGNLGDPVKEILHRIVLSNDRLVNLVENLLSVSRMEAGRMEYKFEEQRFEDIITELYDSFSFAAKSKNLTLNLSLPEHPLPVLQLDKQKIQEVISNLIDNAIKYTNVGNVDVTLDQNPENKKVRFTVKDSGIGIPKEEIPFLFTKFSRGKDINRLHANGTGLGLYVAKNIIEAHKGAISIESEGDGKGTAFIVELG